MNDDVLLRFLNKGLINVGGDDDKLKHLREIAGDLCRILEKTPAKASPFALVAFDPDPPATDPTIVEVADALRNRWETYVNTFDGPPVTVFRAMLLDALVRACGRKDTVAAAFAAFARNVLPFMEVGGERDIWADVVGEIERKVEARAEREWTTPALISVPDLNFDPPSGVEEGFDLPGFTRDLMRVMSEHMTTTLQAVSNATAGLQRRTALLWWKEALFSPSARMSYREMATFDAAVLMAFDMHRHIPTFSPASVAAFLRETVISLPTIDQEQRVPIRELVEKTQSAGVLAELRTETGKLVSVPAGRGSILGLIGHPDAVRQIDDYGFRNLVGVKPDTMLTLPDWSVWMFRELQAVRAIAEAAVPKHRTSRKRTSRK